MITQSECTLFAQATWITSLKMSTIIYTILLFSLLIPQMARLIFCQGFFLFLFFAFNELLWCSNSESTLQLRICCLNELLCQNLCYTRFGNLTISNDKDIQSCNLLKGSLLVVYDHRKRHACVLFGLLIRYLLGLYTRQMDKASAKQKSLPNKNH